MKNDVSDISGHLAVQIDIIGEGEGAFYIELKDHELHVEPYEYYDHDCKFIVSGKNFLKLFLFRKMCDIICLTSIEEAITMVQLFSKRYGFANMLFLLCASDSSEKIK